MGKVSGGVGRFIWLLILLMSTKAGARPTFSTCLPRTMNVFSQWGARQLAENVLDDWHKISRSEFRTQLQISSGDQKRLSAGTELSVLLDVGCLVDSPHSPQLSWLAGLSQQIKQSARRGELKGSALGLKSFAWRLETEWDFELLQRTLDLETCVRMASPNASYHMLASFNDPFVVKQRHLQQMGFQDALEKMYLPFLVRKKATIAVIDSGVDLTHQDLQSNRWVNAEEIAGNGVDDDRNGYVDDINGYNFASDIGDSGPQGVLPEAKHGTHVAGLAAARVDNGVGGMGVNGVARIMSLNIFGPTASTSSVLLENAIRYAANQRADVINMSLGGREYSRTMREALSYAISKGSFIVTASGNFGHEICEDPDQLTFVSPAAYAHEIRGMVAVGSVDVATHQLSTFSNYSKRLVEIAAPGAITSEVKVGLLSTMPGNRYGELAGTSMSAPLVSGAASLAILWLKTYGYEVSPAKIESILLDSAQRSPQLTDSIQEGRVLDLRNLTNYMAARYPVAPPTPVRP